MGKRLWFIFIVLLVMVGFFCIAIQAAAVEFSADLTMTDTKGKVATGKILIKGDKIRQEITAEGETSITILRLDKKLSWTLLPENQYMEVSFPFNPNEPQKDLEYEVTSLGRENVNSYDCEVTQYIYKNKKYGVLVQWVYQKLGYPVKIQTKDAKGKIMSTIEYTNIKIGNLADSLFEIPAGYQKMGFSIKLPGM